MIWSVTDTVKPYHASGRRTWTSFGAAFDEASVTDGCGLRPRTVPALERLICGKRLAGKAAWSSPTLWHMNLDGQPTCN